MLVKIDSIKINERLRDVDESKVRELAESIQKIGMLNPITLSKDNELIAGMHRLRACQLLGLTEIEARVVELDEQERELAEIDENLIRYDLHYTDRGTHLKRRKEIYEEKYPETKKGQYGHKGDTVIEKPENGIITFSEDTASKLNISESTVQQEIQIVENLIRYDLHYTDRGEHLRRRKKIYEDKYPETKHGGDRKSEKIKLRNPQLDEQERELAEIDENLIRYDLHYTDRGTHLKRRKEIYEEKYPETKKGQYGHKGNIVVTKAESADSAVSGIPSFVEDTSEKAGISKRVIHEEIQIAEHLTPEVRQMVKELGIPKNAQKG